MKAYILTLCLIIFNLTFSQENEEVSFSIIEDVPVYKGCDESLSSKELKMCMAKSIQILVAENFNTSLADKLNLPKGLAKIYVSFKVNKKGRVVDIEARGPHAALEAEAIRIIKKIPKLRPGLVRGKPVIVPYSLPIAFLIE